MFYSFSPKKKNAFYKRHCVITLKNECTFFFFFLWLNDYFSNTLRIYKCIRASFMHFVYEQIARFSYMNVCVCVYPTVLFYAYLSNGRLQLWAKWKHNDNFRKLTPVLPRIRVEQVRGKPFFHTHTQNICIFRLYYYST